MKDGDSLNWKMLADTIEIKTIDIKGGEEDMILLNGKTKIIQIESDGSDHKQIIHLNPEDEGEVQIIELHEDGKHKKSKSKKRVKARKTDGSHSRVVIRSNSSDAGRVKVISDTDDEKIIVRTSSGKEPLYVVDGKIVKKKKMIDLNPNNIESVNVLKGDAAKELYGRKGKNGVVVIKTKKE